jgi:hypothetical protein
LKKRTWCCLWWIARWPDAGGLRYRQTPAFTRKAAFLVANKTDGIDADQAVADFWSLGLGEIYRCGIAVAA